MWKHWFRKEKPVRIAIMEQRFAFSNQNRGGLSERGLTQVWETELSPGRDVSVSGISGIGHILTRVCPVLLQIKKQAAD